MTTLLEQQLPPAGPPASSKKRVLADSELLPNLPPKRPRLSDPHPPLNQANGSHGAVYLSTLPSSLPDRVGGSVTVSNPLPTPQASLPFSDRVASVPLPTEDGAEPRDDARETDLVGHETRLNRQSEQIFYRHPITVEYDSPIFVCAQSGNIKGMRYLWSSSLASIDAVDPYGLGLFYVCALSQTNALANQRGQYSTYYCWRNCGIKTSLATCKALVDAGANVKWLDDMGRYSHPASLWFNVLGG